MGINNNWSALFHLRRAVKKIRLFLGSFNIHRWRPRRSSILGAPGRRTVSFNDRMGLHELTQNGVSNENKSTHCLQRTRNYAFDDDEDINRRAEMFIANFRRQLRLERQISLELRYCRGNSF